MDGIVFQRIEIEIQCYLFFFAWIFQGAGCPGDIRFAPVVVEYRSEINPNMNLWSKGGVICQ